MTTYTLDQLRAMSERELDATAEVVIFGGEMVMHVWASGEIEWLVAKDDVQRRVRHYSTDHNAAALLLEGVERREKKMFYGGILGREVMQIDDGKGYGIWRLITASPRDKTIAAILACQD